MMIWEIRQISLVAMYKARGDPHDVDFIPRCRADYSLTECDDIIAALS